MTEEIISAIGTAISIGFGSEYAIYEEEVKQGVMTPCFFIACEKPSQRQFFGSRYFRENRFCITFFPADDNEKNKECRQAAQELLSYLEWLDVNGQIIMGRKMSYEIKEGVLYFYVNYDMFVYKKEEKTLMGELSKRIGAQDR